MDESEGNTLPGFVRKHKRGTTLSLRVIPRSSKTGPLGVHNRGVEYRWGVAAVPTEGRANAELLKSLARCVEISAKRLEILSGHSSRSKVVLFEGLRAERILKALDSAGGRSVR